MPKLTLFKGYVIICGNQGGVKMSINDEIDQLEIQIKNLRIAQANCKHVWGKAVYDPEEKPITKWVEDYHIQTEYFYKEVPTGEIEKIDRWSRTCEKCGLKEYTKDAELVKVLKRPVFKD